MTPISNFGWQDSPSVATPLDAANLEAFGQSLGAYSDAKDLVPTTSQNASGSFQVAPQAFAVLDTTNFGGTSTPLLPNAPVNGTRVAVRWAKGANVVTVQRQGSDIIFAGGSVTATSVALLLGQTMVFQYVNATSTWHVIGDIPTTIASTAAVASTTLIPSGGDDSAAMVAALAKGGLIMMGAGTFLWNTSVPAFARSKSATIQGSGVGVTTIKLSSGAPRAFDFNKVADYDTFSQITLRDFTVDANSVATGGHIVIGTNQAGTQQARINLDQITVQRVTFVNAPIAGRVGVQLSVTHAAASETQTTTTNITVKDFRGFGGECLVLISGSYSTGINTVGLNVFIDHVHISDWYHSLLTAPVGFVAATHIQIGSFAFGGDDIYIGPGYGEYSGDDGIEINAMQHAIVDGVTIRDSWNQGYRLTNFGAPAVASTQRVEYRNCRFIKSASAALPAGSGTGWSFPIAATNVNTSSIVLDECSYYRGTPETLRASEAITCPGASGFGSPSIKIRNFRAVADQISANAGSTTGSFFDVNAQGPACELDIDGFYAKLTGTVTGATAASYAVRIANATSIGGTVKRIVTDYNLTGAVAHTFFGLAVGISGSVLTVSTLEITGMILQTMTGDAAPQGIQIRGTSLLTIAGRIDIHDNDWTTASNNNDVGFNADVAVNTTNTRLRSNKYKLAPAPSTLTGLTTATGAVTGKSYDCLAIFTQGSGTSITAIDISTNGGTNYTNFLTQGSGALPAGFSQTCGPLPADALIKVTFTGTQPTINLVPVNP